MAKEDFEQMRLAMDRAGCLACLVVVLVVVLVVFVIDADLADGRVILALNLAP